MLVCINRVPRTSGVTLSENAEATDTPTAISTGTGIAIAGIWVAAGLVQTTSLIVDFLYSKHADITANLNAISAFCLVVLTFLPTIMAFWATQHVLKARHK